MAQNRKSLGVFWATFAGYWGVTLLLDKLYTYILGISILQAVGEHFEKNRHAQNGRFSYKSIEDKKLAEAEVQF